MAHTIPHPFKVGARVRVIERRPSGTTETVDTVAAHHKGNGNVLLEGTGPRQFRPYSLPQGARTLWRAHAVGVPAGAVYELRPLEDGPDPAQGFADALERLRAVPLARATPEAVAALQDALRACEGGRPSR